MEELNIELFLGKYCRILDFYGNLYVGEVANKVVKVDDTDTITIKTSNGTNTILVDEVFLIELYQKEK